MPLSFYIPQWALQADMSMGLLDDLVPSVFMECFMGMDWSIFMPEAMEHLAVLGTVPVEALLL